MPIGTYQELQNAVADWLNRGDLTARIRDFIALGELRMNRDLRIGGMEAQTMLATTAGYATLALPADFLEVRSLVRLTNPPAALSYSTPADLSTQFSGSGAPVAHTFVGGGLKVGPTPDATYALELTYYRRIPPLSDAVPTTWALSALPDLYLYAALVESAPFLGDDARTMTWGQLYDAGVKKVEKADDAARYNGAPLVIRSRIRW